MTRAKDISKILTDADLSGNLDVTGDLNVDNATLKVDSTNNRVGISTSSMTSKFEVAVSDNTSIQEAITIKGTQGGAYGGYLGWKDNWSGDSYTGYRGAIIADVPSANSGRLRFFTANSSTLSEKMRIDASGNVGIGTSSPDSILDLTSTPNNNFIHFNSTTGGNNGDIIGGFEVNNTGGTIGKITVHRESTNSSGYIAFQTATTEKMRIDSSGRVMIGNTTEGVAGADELTVGDTSAGNGITIRSASNSSGALFFSDGTSGSAEYDGGFEYNHPSQFMRISTAGSEQMRITSAGKVGINETSPLGILHIKEGDSGVSSVSTDADQLVIENNAEAGISILAPTNSASRIAFGDSDNNKIGMVYYNHSSNYMQFTTNNDERMRIDSSGNVGIGLSSPQELLHLKDGSIAIGNGTASNNAVIGRIGFSTDSSNSRFIGIESFRGGDAANADLRFHTFGGDGDNGERMRIKGNGSVHIANSNVTGNSGDNGVSFHTNGRMVSNADNDWNFEIYGAREGRFRFFTSAGGSATQVGSIRTNGSSTSYNTTSDHRLKENLTADWDATTRLKQLNPVRFNFTADADTTVDGFLAHEVQSVVPEAISGTHNEVDDDGNPVYQGIDQSKLVPLLVKTIQELEARIVALETA